MGGHGGGGVQRPFRVGGPENDLVKNMNRF